MLLAGITNTGKERARNEDSFFLQDNAGSSVLLAVADGMGGHKAGNVASSMAVSTAERYWHEYKLDSKKLTVAARLFVHQLITEANRLILAEADQSATQRGMGTTFTVGFIESQTLTIGHVGDSRAYLICQGQIEALTKDHSLVEKLIESGEVKPEEAQNHPQKHIITRALGTCVDLEVDLIERELAAESTLIFCTDGLTNLVNDREILDICLEKPDPQSMVEALVELANSKGGFDNITVVIASGIGGQIT